ncbi:MAG: hypothetical protein U0744_02540 [Gemmataceae bacterium]
MGEAIGWMTIIAIGVLLGMQAHTFLIGMYARHAYRKHRDRAIKAMLLSQQSLASVVKAKGNG